MAIETPSADTSALQAATPGRVGGRASGVGLMLGSSLCNQTGASVAALAFPVIGPVGVVAVRQWVAAVVLLCVGRPRPWSFTGAQWRLVLGLALVFAAMNLSLYSAVDRIGLGLAVTLEFLGPLAVALIGSRRRVDVVCALAAAVAVVELTRPRPSTDYLGIGLALLAATCWACYILLNRAVGQRVPGLQGSAAAAGVSGLACVPVGVVVLWHHPPTLTALLCAVTAGVLSSAIPFLADLLALRRVPAHFFGVFMSVNPVFAALVGMLVLGQHLEWRAWAAILVIVVANAVAVAAVRPAPPAVRPAPPAVRPAPPGGRVAPPAVCPAPPGGRVDRVGTAGERPERHEETPAG